MKRQWLIAVLVMATVILTQASVRAERPYDVTVSLKTNLGDVIEQPAVAIMQSELSRLLTGVPAVKEGDSPAPYRFAFEFRGRGSVGEPEQSRRDYKQVTYHYWHSQITLNGQFDVKFQKRSGGTYEQIDQWRGTFEYKGRAQIGRLTGTEKVERDLFVEQMKQNLYKIIAEAMWEPAFNESLDRLFPAVVEEVDKGEEDGTIEATVKVMNHSPWTVQYTCKAQGVLRRKLASSHYPAFSFPLTTVPRIQVGPGKEATSTFTMAANPATSAQREKGTIVPVRLRNFEFKTSLGSAKWIKTDADAAGEEIADR